MKLLKDYPRLKVRIYDDSLLTHGCGPYRALTIRFPKWGIRLHSGGYGNIPAPTGCYTRIPKRTHYHRIATHIDFLNFGISILYQPY